MWYGCGNTSIANPSTMHIAVKDDGTVTLYSCAQDIGQGTNTTMMQSADDGLGIALNQLKLITGDTDLTADAGKSSASRQAYVSGNAAKLAGEDLRGQILRMANVGEKASIKFDSGKITVQEKTSTHVIELSSLEQNSCLLYTSPSPRD